MKKIERKRKKRPTYTMKCSSLQASHLKLASAAQYFWYKELRWQSCSGYRLVDYIILGKTWHKNIMKSDWNNYEDDSYATTFAHSCPHIKGAGAQWLNPWLKRPKTLKLFFLKFIIFIMYFVFQSCGMTYRSISEGHFIVLGPQIHTFSGIVRNSYLIQSVNCMKLLQTKIWNIYGKMRKSYDEIVS